MADTVTDAFRSLADQLRTLRGPDVFGVEQVQMQIVTRTWLGGARGADGGYVESAVTIPNYYKIVEVDPEELPDTGGRFEREFVRVGPITPNFTVGSTSGGYTRAQLAPSGVKGTEIIYRLTGSSSSLNGDFKREHIESYRGFQFNLVLSRSRTSTGQTGGSDSQIATLAGLAMWLRGDIQSPAVWSDQSGNGHDAVQVTPANLPSSIASGIGGQPCALFTGATPTYYSVPSAGMATTAAEIFCVLKTNFDASPPNGLWAFGTSGVGSVYRYVDGHIYDDFCSTTYKTTASGEPNTTAAHLLNVISTGTEWTLAVDGVVLYTTPANTFAMPTNFLIGASAQGIVGMSGQIGDVLFFNQKLTNANRTIVKSYAASRYPGLVVA